nr:MAG TPA: hypothetical protein [Caudoviricetes sp.]DAW83261.1 MAG TPA: hypothetical protein [Caudoviricetes sp.]DAY93144.1 MAG TPA: hypothetical protein [Caudoviricetes sp.]
MLTTSVITNSFAISPDFEFHATSHGDTKIIIYLIYWFLFGIILNSMYICKGRVKLHVTVKRTKRHGKGW